MQLMNSPEYLHWLDENQKRVSKWKRRKHTKRYLPRKSQLGYYFGLPEFCNLTSEDEGPEAEMPEREECSQEKENRKPLRNFDPYNTAVPNITFSMEKNLSVFQPLEMTNKLTETTDDTDLSQPIDKRRSSCQSQKVMKKRITNFDPYNMTIPDITFDTENNITVFRHTHRDSQESETASFSQSTEEMRQSMDNAGLSQSQEMLKKRPTNFDPYNQTAPEITFNTENAISYFQSCGGSQVSEVVSISQSSQEISQPVTEEGSSQHQEQPANCRSGLEVRNISINISETYYGEITGSQISVTKVNDLTVERESIRCDQETKNASFSQFGQEASQPAEEKEKSQDHHVTIDPDDISLKDSIQEKEVTDQPKTLATSAAKWKTPFTLPPEVQIQTPQENLLASELTLGPSKNHQKEANEAHEASNQLNPKNIPTREEIQEKEVIDQNQISKIPSDTSSKWKTPFTLPPEAQFSNSQENLSSHDPCLTPQKEPQTDQITTPIQDSTMVSIYNTTIHMNDKENSRILDFNKSQKKLTLTPKNEPPETPKSCSRFAKNQANFGANKSIGCQITPVPAEKSRRRTSVCSMEISKNPSPSRSPSRQSSVNLTKRTRSIAFAAVSDAATSPHHPKFDRRRSMLGIQIPFEENNSRRISVFKNDNNRRRPSIFAQKSILKNSTIDEGTNTESIASPPAKKLASLSTHKPLIPTFGQVSKLIPKRAENESLRKITDYSSPQTFPTPPRFTNALLQLREYNTPKSGPRGMVKKTNIFTPIETTPKSSTKNRTSRLSKNFSHATFSTTISQENGEENEEKQDESFKLADQLKHRLIFEDSQDMGSDYWGSTAKSIQDETEVDEREKGRFSSQNFEGNDEDDHQPDVIGCDEWNNSPSPSTSGSRKSSTMAKLLNESITATEVSTPKPLSRTAMLRWASQTPGQLQTPGQSRKHDRFVVTNKNLDKDTESVTNSPSTNSPPVKHVVFGRGKSPEYILAKPKIHTYEPNVIDSRLGIRRSNRNKVRTLRPWLNEKPVYQADAEGNQTLVDVQTKEVKEKRAKKFLTADPKEQFEREREQKARRKKRQDLAMEMKLHHKKF